MSVVRNEFEMGENEPASVLFKRLQAMLFDWHNYGNSTIGARSDIENVRIENLQAFYRKFYQPDNAVLTVAGKFDEQKGARLDRRHFRRAAAADPLAARTMDGGADGRWRAPVRRSGARAKYNSWTLAYRTPSSLHPTRTPSAWLCGARRHAEWSPLPGAGAERTGDTGVRLHRSNTARAWLCGLRRGAPQGRSTRSGARQDDRGDRGRLRARAATAAELDRAREQARTAYERALADPEAFAVMLSEYIALGDWRLFFPPAINSTRSGRHSSTPPQAKYFVRDNRVLGTFIPDDSPQRAELPQAPNGRRAAGQFPAADQMAMPARLSTPPTRISIDAPACIDASAI
jgi:zinc protease